MAFYGEKHKKSKKIEFLSTEYFFSAFLDALGYALSKNIGVIPKHLFLFLTPFWHTVED